VEARNPGRTVPGIHADPPCAATSRDPPQARDERMARRRMPGGLVTLLPGLSVSPSPTSGDEPTRAREPLSEQQASTPIGGWCFEMRRSVLQSAARNPPPCHRMVQPAPTVRWPGRRSSEGEDHVTAYGIVIGLLLAFPWALVGLTVLGAAPSAVGRWLERRRRPQPVRRSGRSKGFHSRNEGRVPPMSVAPAVGSEASPQPRPMRRAA